MTPEEKRGATPAPISEDTGRLTREEKPERQRRPIEDDDTLDFVVTEAHNQGSDLVGGFECPPSDQLGIESPADLMDSTAHKTEPTADHATGRTPGSLIGQSAPPPPAAAAPSSDAFANDSLDLAGGNLDPPVRETTIEKLSDDRIKEISQRMHTQSAASDYLSDDEKQQLMSAIGHGPEDGPTQEVVAERPRGTGFDTQPIVPPKKKKDPSWSHPEVELSGEAPRISKRLRGIAYFAKGYIQITGQQDLHDGDELTINGREYLLRKKRISNKVLAAVIAPLAAVTAFALGTYFSSDADIGSGRIIGFALGQSDQPYLSGATVRFPELGLSLNSNGQGFFKSEQLDAGTYQIEYVIGDQVVATDYATVADDNITTLILRPEAAAPQATRPRPATAERSPARETVAPQTSAAPPTPQPTSEAGQRAPSKATPAPSRPAEASRGPVYAKLTLNTNVDDARLTLDGSVIGAGNLTYSRLKPGRHSYAVSKDGYQTVNGQVDLTGDKTTALNVTLQPATAQQKAEQYLDQDYYYSALGAIDRGEFETALSDLTEAVTLSPSYTDAYLKRAEVQLQLSNRSAAHDDYLRAAEILQFKRDYNRASVAYQNAIELDNRSIPAYLGRGSLYLARNEAIAAVADFDMVVRMDKRNVDGYIGLGRARYNQGYFEKAAKHFKDARSIDSNNPVIYQYLMLSYFGAGEFKEVRKAYDRFLKCASDNQVQQMKADSRFAPVFRILE